MVQLHCKVHLRESIQQRRLQSFVILRQWLTIVAHICQRGTQVEQSKPVRLVALPNALQLRVVRVFDQILLEPAVHLAIDSALKIGRQPLSREVQHLLQQAGVGAMKQRLGI